MKILVLGGNGFIGKNLCRYLSELKHQVISFDISKDKEDKDNIKYIEGDFFDDEDLIPCLEGIDIVYHAISTINPGNSNQKYMQGYTYDFLQSVKLCELSNSYHFRLIYLSSGGTVYGYQEKMPICEETMSIPINHYGNLKLCIENTLRTFHQQSGTDAIIARVANPYGPGQDYSRGVGFIDAALKKAMHGQTIEVWGDGSVIRDYIYIEDVCHMLSLLVDYQGDEKVFNISSNQGTSQKEILDIVEKLIPDISIQYMLGRTVDVPQIVLDNSRIKAMCPQRLCSVEEGIRMYYLYLKNIY